MLTFPTLGLALAVQEVNKIWHSYRDGLINEEQTRKYLCEVKGLDNFEVLELMKLMEKNKHGQVRQA